MNSSRYRISQTNAKMHLKEYKVNNETWTELMLNYLLYLYCNSIKKIFTEFYN